MDKAITYVGTSLFTMENNLWLVDSSILTRLFCINFCQFVFSFVTNLTCSITGRPAFNVQQNWIETVLVIYWKYLHGLIKNTFSISSSLLIVG